MFTGYQLLAYHGRHWYTTYRIWFIATSISTMRSYCLKKTITSAKDSNCHYVCHDILVLDNTIEVYCLVDTNK